MTRIGTGQIQPQRPQLDTQPATTTAAEVARTGTTSPAEVARVDGAQWNNYADNARPAARMTGLTSTAMDSTGLIDFAWDKPGDSIAFELKVEVNGDASKVKAELWSNANNNAEPDRYDAIPMQLVKQEGAQATYRVDVPIDKLGNYRATARISNDDGRSYSWASQNGIQDLRFRPRDEAHDALNFMEVNVGNANYDEKSKRYGTFADLMDSGSPESNGKYTLEFMAAQGKTAIWLQPPFEVNKWEYRHPLDDAGSPYAVKDYFSVRTELARSAQGLEGDAAREAAMKEFSAFVDKAHSLGIKVVLDVALNHVGHNYDFRDLFVRYDEAGREIREVRKNDFSNVVVDPAQLDVIKNKLDDPQIPDYMEYVAPWMYGSRFGDPNGAMSVDEKAIGGWGQWDDVAQLNHGARNGHEFGNTAANHAVRDWLTRILQFWSVDMQCDGFRLDHLSGLPTRFLEEAFNLAQADVDKHAPGKHLFVMGEDFHNIDNTRHFLDTIQGGWFHRLVRARNPQDIRGVFEDPYFKRNLINLSSHDEARFINSFGDDYRAATRMGCLLELLGGPVMELAGDHFGERQQLQFKQYKGMPALRNISTEQKEIAKTYKRTGLTRQKLASLQDDNRAFLNAKVGGPDPDLLAVSRWPDSSEQGEPTFVLCNFNNSSERENAFWLDDATRARIDPKQKYQVRDLMGDDMWAPIWNPPMTGQELLDKGVFAKLRPYQIQVLKLEKVD